MKFNFNIERDKGLVSDRFLAAGMIDFAAAARYIRQLPYRRNKDKTDPVCVFEEACGTCSTKHAVLRRLAAEQGQEGVQLFLGIFRMNRTNTPRVIPVLERYNLPYIPEAHNYLRIGGHIEDCTRNGSSAKDFEAELLEEQLITPEQVDAYKVTRHKAFIRQWQQETASPYSAEELWKIREACIAALSGDLSRQ